MKNENNLLIIVETALLCAVQPLSLAELVKMFPDNQVTTHEIKKCLAVLQSNWQERGLDLVQVASGWRFQSKPFMQAHLARLNPQRAPRYSRAVLETLAIIAWYQPVTRGDIESIRGVSVSSQIIRTLEDREWIETVGYKQVPGKPALLATTRQFLNDLGLRSLEDLPEINMLDASDMLANLNLDDDISSNTQDSSN